jgi:hypothetical protein
VLAGALGIGQAVAGRESRRRDSCLVASGKLPRQTGCTPEEALTMNFSGRANHSRALVPFLLAVIVLLTGVCIWQQRIIQQQSFEIRWLLANPARK